MHRNVIGVLRIAPDVINRSHYTQRTLPRERSYAHLYKGEIPFTGFQTTVCEIADAKPIGCVTLQEILVTCCEFVENAMLSVSSGTSSIL